MDGVAQPKPKRQKRPKEPAAIIIPAPTKKPWELTEAEVELVRNHIAKGASNEELSFCLGVARRYKLDPFRGQIWFVKRRDKSLDRYDKETKKNVPGYRWIPIVGINGLLHIAARDHKKSFGSIGQVQYGPMKEVEWSRYDEVAKKFFPAGKIQAPEWARVEAFKRGDPVPTIGEVYWDEIYPNVDSAPLVRQMPRLMLGKCAKAQAVRAAYPATDGLYIQEEFMVEQMEPTGNAKLSLSKVSEIDERIAKFKELSGGKPPTEEQCSLLEQGQTPEQVLLAASVASGETNPKPKETPLAKQEGSVSPALFYIWHEESKTAEVTGSRELMKAHWGSLKPFWNGNAQAVVMKDHELEDMKFYFERKGVQFKPLQAAG
jgi:RecT family